ncbi:MAG: hypothetical protein M3179_02565 [Actinomycetota bacterium]|nr:hypothetical protein [Actinomycetota bacterium]
MSAVVADYDGDARADIAVYRPSIGAWFASLSSGGSAYVYHERGNRTQRTPALGPTVNYRYDQANRLVGAGTDATYIYNGDGLRMSKTVGNLTTRFTWDQSGELPLLLDDGTNACIYGPDGLPLEQVGPADTPTWYHHDQIGSTRGLIDKNGKVVGSAMYDPYGRLVAHNGHAQPLGLHG